MAGRWTAVVVGAAVMVCGVPAGASAEPAAWRPRVMAALGDSISTGFNVCGWFVSCRSRSWSTGGYAKADSHYLRLRREGAPLAGNNLNLAVAGARSGDLAEQARRAVDRGAEYVTVLIGANDACARTEKAMTPVGEFRRNVARALGVLREGGDVRVLVASVPDLKRLWSAGRGNVLARSFWSTGRVCASMLARPASMAKADRDRRDRVRERVMAYNRVLEEECAAFGPGCRFDGGAVFTFPFSLDHVSKWDYFHPNARGQQAIADRTFPLVQEWLREPVMP